MLRTRKKLSALSFVGILGLAVATNWLFKVDPYATPTKATPFFTTHTDANGSLSLEWLRPVKVRSSFPLRLLSLYKAGASIIRFAYRTEPKLAGTDTQIISTIDQKRFDITKPYPITGGHYSDLYVRNLGIFFNALVDPRINSSDQEWLTHQRIALQTVAFDLELLKQSRFTPTTFIPITTTTYIPANIYAPASDSLFSVLYTLSALSQPTFISDLYPTSTDSARPLSTQLATRQLIDTYQPTLHRHLEQYRHNILDQGTGLVKTDIHLSSARDGIKRQSSFYDNVIAWSTFKLASQLGVYELPADNLATWKQKIISTYWNPDLGIFNNDLSKVTNQDQNFSADTLIVLNSGFIDLSNLEEREYLDKTISYIRVHKLDQPFPLRYSYPVNPKNLYITVRYLTKGYMDNSIWSHWGMEYIKALVLLSPDHPEYLLLAQKHLESYRNNLTKFGGFPELYSLDGNIFKTPFYKSVLHTGWVVNYQQAQWMYANTKG